MNCDIMMRDFSPGSYTLGSVGGESYISTRPVELFKPPAYTPPASTGWQPPSVDDIWSSILQTFAVSGAAIIKTVDSVGLNPLSNKKENFVDFVVTQSQKVTEGAAKNIENIVGKGLGGAANTLLDKTFGDFPLLWPVVIGGGVLALLIILKL